MKEIVIKSDHNELAATVFESGNDSDAVLIIASATGVKQSYYQHFAQFASDQKTTVVTFDYVGIGKSLRQPIKELTNYNR